jgi:hypothetical protein
LLKAQNPGEVWYLETLNYVPFVPNDEVQSVVLNFGNDGEITYLDTSVCGNLKAHIEFTMCWCDEFGVLDVLELNDTECSNPENTQLQQDYFTFFLGNGEYFPVIGYNRDNLGNGVERLNLYSGDEYQATFLNVPFLSVSDSENKKIEIYPNPVKDILHFTQVIKHGEIYSISGVEIMSFDNMDKINISDFQEGTYMMKLQTGNDRMIVRKFTKN